MNLTEEEFKKLKKEILEDLEENYFAMKRPGFNIESNCMTQAHGIAEFIIATDENQGIQFHKKGSAQMLANESMEIVAGGRLKDNNAFAITLDARSGNIMISAPDGELILKGGKVQIIATDDDGDVTIRSGKTANIEAPEVKLDGTKVDMTAKSDLHIQGGICEIYSQTGSTVFTSGQDPVSAPTLLGKIVANFDRPGKLLRSVGIV